MASWLKVAEDLLEVVDRRAKLVAHDIAEEQSESKPPGLATNGEELQPTRAKPKEKAPPGLTMNEPTKKSETAPEQNNTQISGDNTLFDTDRKALSSEDTEVISRDNTTATSVEPQLDLRQDGTMPGVPLADTLPNDVGRPDNTNSTETPIGSRADDTSNIETPAAVDEVIISSINNGNAIENASESHEVFSASISTPSGGDSIDGDNPADAGQNVKLAYADVPLKIDHKETEVESVEPYDEGDTPANTNSKEEPRLDLKKKEEPKHEPKTDNSSKKVQEQLDEAQGLLKTAISTGQSKEARLAKVCAGLSSRLQEYKSENAQLEELLSAERERTNSYEFRIKQLQKDLSMSKIEVSRAESNRAGALAAKNSEIEALVSSLDAVKKHASVSEGKLASLQANMESIMRNRELTETRMMQAVREELASAERRVEEEHAAHNAIKKAAMQREVELEHRAIEASTALARLQRSVDKRTSQVAELEQKVAFLEAESASLNQELQDMEALARRGQKRTTEEANQALQVQAWQEEVERACQGQRDSENKLSSLEEDQGASIIGEFLHISEIHYMKNEPAPSLNRSSRPMSSTPTSLSALKSSFRLSPSSLGGTKQDSLGETHHLQHQKDQSLFLSLADEAELQKMRVEMAGMKRDAEHYSRQEHMELEKRYRELTDLLYHKQTQLETMASEKAAAEFQLEKEVKRVKEAQVEAERTRAPRRTSSTYWEEVTDLKTLEPLPRHHRHIAGASLRLQKAAKLLDSGAVRATRFLWQYPIARVMLLCYLVFVHFSLMYLLHRLQEQADDFAAREVAVSMGLAQPNLP